MSMVYKDAVTPEVYDAVLGSVLTAIKRLDLRYTYGTPEEGGRCETRVVTAAAAAFACFFFCVAGSDVAWLRLLLPAAAVAVPVADVVVIVAQHARDAVPIGGTRSCHKPSHAYRLGHLCLLLRFTSTHGDSPGPNPPTSKTSRLPRSRPWLRFQPYRRPIPLHPTDQNMFLNLVSFCQDLLPT